MNVVDSSAWLAYFADEANAEYFSPAIEDTENLLVPSICLYEVFRVLLRESGEDAAFAAIGAMLQGTVLDLDAEYSLEAAAVGVAENLAVADSIIYTVMLKHDATLWTQNAHFEGKRRVNFQPKKP